MFEEEYRGHYLTAVQTLGGMWQVSIYPLELGQIIPTRERQMAQAVAQEDAFVEARRRVDALLAGAGRG